MSGRSSVACECQRRLDLGQDFRHRERGGHLGNTLRFHLRRRPIPQRTGEALSVVEHLGISEDRLRRPARGLELAQIHASFPVNKTRPTISTPPSRDSDVTEGEYYSG